MNSLLGTSSGGVFTINLLPFAANRPKLNTVKPIQATGGGECKVTHHFSHSIPFITGETINQPGYKCLTNTVPSIPTYIVFGWTSNSTNVTNGMVIAIKIKFLVEYLDYIDTLTSYTGEEDRLRQLGAPQQVPCGGCRAVQDLEFLPCPDPSCSIVDYCTNCGFKRRCSLNCQSSRCPFKQDTIQIFPPVVTRTTSKDSLLVKTQAC
jgi:hypothetical protein